MNISAVIITFNEEKNIREAIKSVLWADEVIVVDSHSTDRTREIAEEMGAKVIERDWPGFAAQKQFAVDAARFDWVMSIDADERVTDELRDEILAARNRPVAADAFRMPRLAFYMGRPIRHAGWYPDKQIRLFDRRKARWKPLRVHESLELETGADVGELSGHLLHYSVRDAAHHHRMIGERYAPLAAEQMHLNGRETSPLRVAVAGPAAFVRSYLLKLGFLDGLPGFAIARFAAHHAFLKHLMLWEMQNAKSTRIP